MRFVNKQQAINLINEYSYNNDEFLFAISFDQSQCFVHKINEIDRETCLFAIDGETNSNYLEFRGSLEYFKYTPQSYNHFQEAFKVVTKNIQYGNSFLTNLTLKTPIETNLSIKEIYHLSRAKYRLWLKDNFVVFSPETFIKIEDGHIFSYPMKGTIDANQPNANETLLQDPKEIAEHVTIVDLIRNDLSIVADHVNVTRFRYIDELRTHKGNLLQVSSEIKGKIREEYNHNLGDLIFSLLPAGSISGAPKPETLQIISDAENYKRQFYTGVMGHYKDGKLDSGVMIRFIEQETDGLFFKSGGGITHFSDPRKEYQEYLDKIYIPIPQKAPLVQS